ncbi:hypothetical protein, partial [Streptomyces albogriseolus]|uniref:hypothetical protein n=1 Tax=Streptomyces albogriseolus TaxID=1887 RepID=UPI003F4D33AD
MKRLWTLHRARAAGILPADTTLKVSALVGPVNPACQPPPAEPFDPALLGGRVGGGDVDMHAVLAGL